MWINKQRYKCLLEKLHVAEQESAILEAKYKVAIENKGTMINNDIVVISADMLQSFSAGEKAAKKELMVTQQELAKWKQKYADEVQKRLALIEQAKY